MENPTPFDLNSAIHRWRMNWQHSPALGAAEVDELEAHLRDSTRSLQAAGLTPEEAFLVASRRLGQRQELQREFGKLNRRRVWEERALWMVAGLLMFSCIAWSAALAWELVVNLLLPSSLNGHWVGLLAISAKGVVMASTAGVFWWIAPRVHERLAAFVQICVQQPLWPAFGLVLLNYGYVYSYQALTSRWMSATLSNGDSRLKLPALNAWAIFGSRAELVLWAAGLVYLARRQWRTSRNVMPQAEKPCLEDLELPLRERSRALLAAGLTMEEAVLLVTRTETPNNTLALVADKASRHELWLDRGVWMIAGILLGRYFIGQEWKVLLNPLFNLARWIPLDGNILGVSAVCVQFGMAVLLVFALWSLVSRCERLTSQITRLILEHPVLGILGMGLVYFGFLRLVTLPPFMQSADATDLVFLWSRLGYHFLYNVISVVLLFWLARRRMRRQEAG